MKLQFIILLMFGYVFAYSQKSNTEPQGGLNLPVPPSGNPNTPSIEQQEALRDYAIITVNEIEENTSFISKLNSVDSALILPQGISKKIGGIRYTIAIDSMKFKPDGAYGRLGVPEWKSPYNTPNEGAELYEVFANGDEILKAKFSSTQNKFIPIQ